MLARQLPWRAVGRQCVDERWRLRTPCVARRPWYDEPRYLRSANRYRSSTGNRVNIVGFRVARTLD